MSYSTNLTNDQVQTGSFIVIQPRLKVYKAEWTLYSGNIYTVPFPHGYPWDIFNASSGSADPTGARAVSSIGALTSGKLYFDQANSLLYFHAGGVLNAEYLVVFDMTVSTHDVLWYRDPTDSTSALVNWNSCVKDKPVISTVSTDQTFGIFTKSASGFRLIYSPELHQEMLDKTAWRNAPVKIYQLAGTPDDTDNFEKVFDGILDDKVEMTDFSTITFGITQPFGVFDVPLPVLEVDITDGTSWDPSANNYCIRLVLTWLEQPVSSIDGAQFVGLLPVNQTYDDTTPTTANNRDWVVMYDAAVDMLPSYAVAGTGAGTTTKTIPHADALVLQKIFGTGFVSPGYVDVLNGVTHNKVTVSSVDTTANTITFSASVAAGAVTIYVYCVGDVKLIQNNVRYDLAPKRDYITVWDNQKIVLQLTATAEANVGASTINPANGDFILACNITPFRAVPTILGSPYNSEPIWIYETSGGVSGVYYFLKHIMGFDESEMNLTTFLEAESHMGITSNYNLFSVFPRLYSDPNMSCKDVLNQYLRDCKCILYFDKDGYICIRYVGDTTTSQITILEEEIIGGIQFIWDSSDITYARWFEPWMDCHLATNGFGSSSAFTVVRPYIAILETGHANNVSNDDGTSFKSAIVEDLTKRISTSRPMSTVEYARKGLLRFNTSLRLTEQDVGSTVTLESRFLPGFAYDGETTYTKDYVLVEVEKTNDGVMIYLDDMKRFTG